MMEPEAQHLAGMFGPEQPGPGAVAAVSIAISLKRIADQLEGVPYDPTPGANNSGHRLGLVDGIMHAIEQGLLSASQR